MECTTMTIEAIKYTKYNPFSKGSGFIHMKNFSLCRLGPAETRTFMIQINANTFPVLYIKTTMASVGVSWGL